jgi:ABC-2 type transport system ATP-binding protein
MFWLLRKGEVLYSGRVNEMTANEGFFEIQADDNEVLKSAFSIAPLQIDSIKEEENKLYVYLKSPLEVLN